MENYTYYIYLIEGVKIGATSDFEKRMSDQGFTEWEILWQAEGDWDFGWVVGEKEQELQKLYKYPVDKSNYQISREHRRKMGMSGGHVTSRIRKNGAFQQSEVQRELAKRPRSSYGPGHVFSNEERSKAHVHANSLRNKRIICQHCNKQQTTANYARWHGDKCKNKNN